MSELAIFLGKLGTLLCVISIPIKLFAFRLPVETNFIEGFFCSKLIDFELFEKIIKEIKERLKTNNKDSIFVIFKFWFVNILALISILIILCAHITFYLGLCCLIVGLILVLIY